MTKEEFIKQFRAPMWDLALESFYQARLTSGRLSTDARASQSEAMLSQMTTAVGILGKMYDAMNQKGAPDADRKAK
jgi:hypothetical protein